VSYELIILAFILAPVFVVLVLSDSDDDDDFGGGTLSPVYYPVQ